MRELEKAAQSYMLPDRMTHEQRGHAYTCIIALEALCRHHEYYIDMYELDNPTQLALVPVNAEKAVEMTDVADDVIMADEATSQEHEGNDEPMHTRFPSSKLAQWKQDPENEAQLVSLAADLFRIATKLQTSDEWPYFQCKPTPLAPKWEYLKWEM